MENTLENIISCFEKGKKLKYLFFWGHQPSADGSITKSCFSQWWVCPFVVDGKRYATAEHWMMAKKAVLFDPEMIEKILDAKSPDQAKRLGRMIKNFDAKIWDEHKFEIVVEGNFQKFNQHKTLKEYLLNTKDRVLVEASPVDKIWGIGMAVDHQNIENPKLWKGENLLGFALMDVREKLKS